MKNKLFLLLLLLVIPNSVFGQKALYILLSIDSNIVEPTFISNSKIEIDNKVFNLNYKMGRFDISEEGYSFLIKSAQQINAKISFDYISLCPIQTKYSYSFNVKGSFFLQEYLLLKFYNFNKYPNQFAKNTGYGYEFTSPLGSESIPRKKKFKKDKCF